MFSWKMTTWLLLSQGMSDPISLWTDYVGGWLDWS